MVSMTLFNMWFALKSHYLQTDQQSLNPIHFIARDRCIYIRFIIIYSGSLHVINFNSISLYNITNHSDVGLSIFPETRFLDREIEFIEYKNSISLIPYFMYLNKGILLSISFIVYLWRGGKYYNLGMHFLFRYCIESFQSI